ncbi:MAG TPA: BTAD domain-containing putative transcriptional regulator, partial [Streptosporangiaceae bacterium]|nr:BTAD domain-containing putative transcriptional regulator [Streptosporangiaceae bacterium]
MLLLNANRVVTRNAMIDAVWGDEPPTSAVNVVHTYVSRLRQILEPGRGPRQTSGLLAAEASGYVLRLSDQQLDLAEFEILLDQARASRDTDDLAAAVRAYAAALALWNGPPLAGIPGPLAATEQARIEELHVAAIEDRAEAMLGLGGHRELVGELAALATAHPLRERT